MLSGEEFRQWCSRLSLSAEAQAVFTTIRAAGPTRRVGGGRENVSGRSVAAADLLGWRYEIPSAKPVPEALV